MISDVVIMRDFVTAKGSAATAPKPPEAIGSRQDARTAGFRYTIHRDPKDAAQQARTRAWALRGHMMLDGLTLTASLLGGTCIAAQLIRWCCAR